jgi:hypothetical protein
MITEFQGQWRWLSNFWPANVMYDGHMFPSSEHAYVAAKINNPKMYAVITTYTVAQAKRYGKPFQWGTRDRRAIMLEIVRDKFTRNPALQKALLATGDTELQEGNRWNDRYWGICPPDSGQGQNELGKILMQVRKELA